MHVLVLGTLLVGGVAVLTGGDEGMIHAMGRNSNLTGRTEIWQRVISMAPNAVVGAGFESFWLGPRLDKLWHSGYAFPINEAHDGYIEVYLELGWIGVALIVLILIHGYRSCIAAFRADPNLGNLMLAYVLTAPLYSITEAGFRMLHPEWSFLLLAIFGATQISLLATKTPSPTGYPLGLHHGLRLMHGPHRFWCGVEALRQRRQVLFRSQARRVAASSRAQCRGNHCRSSGELRRADRVSDDLGTAADSG